MSSRQATELQEEALRYAPPSSFKDEEIHFVRAAVRARLNRVGDQVAFYLVESDQLTRYIMALSEEIQDRGIEAPF